MKTFENGVLLRAQFEGPQVSPEAVTGTFAVEYAGEDEFTYVRLVGEAVEAGHVKGGRRTTTFFEPGASEHALIAARYMADKAVVHAFGKRFDLPRLGRGNTITAGPMGLLEGFELSHFDCRPVNEVFFTDSFMRSQPSGEWEAVDGRWEIMGMQNPDKSANPFSLVFKSAERTTVDRLFDRGRISDSGLGFSVGGEPYTKGAEVTLVLEGPAKAAGLKEGDSIIAAQGEDVTKMDRAALAKAITDSEKISLVVMREGARVELELQPGTYYRNLKRYNPDQNKFGSDEYGNRGIVVAGDEYWADVVMAASLKPFGTGSLGFVFDMVDGNSYEAIVWNGSSPAIGDPNCIQHISVMGEEVKLNNKYEGGFLPGQYYRVEVSAKAGRISVTVDGHEVLTSAVMDPLFGRCGFMCENMEAVVYDDVMVTNTDRRPERGGFIRKFEDDEIMRYWADHRYDLDSSQAQSRTLSQIQLGKGR
ncbi:MAG: PDZ domain-containing protein [Planctomycetota bacterium]|nr:PDZ domain-containing protein [Planctomycetota bacterium]